MENVLSEINNLSESHQHKLLNHLQLKKKHRQKTIELERYLHLLNKCHAKTSNGKECSRRCIDVVSDYCHCHMDNPEKYQNVKPKTNMSKAPNIEWSLIDYSDYVKCQLIHVNGNHYLIDENGVLFDRKTYTIIGQQIDGEVNFF